LVKWSETGDSAPATGSTSYAERAAAANSRPFRSARYLPGHFLVKKGIRMYQTTH